MSFDSSRFTFNSWNDFAGVVMQQGRVQLDADWNEWLAELGRRIQAGTLDTFGRAVYPETTPNAFAITLTTDASGNPVVSIGPGRMYVDGLLAENHGLPAPTSGGWTPGNANAAGPPPAGLGWDPALAELVGQNPVPFNLQPYLPTAAFPLQGGPYLVYLDVWQREITFIEDPDLVEKAVGVDTTGRLQTVWQVKWLDVSQDGDVTCSTPDASLPAWSNLLLPPGPQLTTGVVQSSPTGPCCIAPNTGYTGLENQLYRVEIQQGGAVGAGATFKWSRDNASVTTAVTSIGQGGASLIVQSTGRDSVLRFSNNDWIEITDDYLELQGLPGELHQIAVVTDASSTITLTTAVSSANFPVDASGNTNPARHTRIVRWDQAGQVLESDGATVYATIGASGDIAVPPAGTALILENGITVSFSELAGGAPFQPGQFWTFAARSTDGTVEFLNAAPPRGIYHHYARLSVVTLPGTASDCRTMWPPSSSSACCECTVNVQPGDLNGNVTLQTIIDQYLNSPSLTTFCLAAGRYELSTPLRLTTGNWNIAIEACQPGTVTIAAAQGQESQFTDGLIVLDTSEEITLRGIRFEIPSATFSGTAFAGLPVASLDPGVSAIVQNVSVSIGLRTINTIRLTIEDCYFGPGSDDNGGQPVTGQGYRFGAAIFANGRLGDVTITGTSFRGRGNFSAGLVLAPSATFVVPGTIEATGKPAAPGNLAGQIGRGAQFADPVRELLQRATAGRREAAQTQAGIAKPKAARSRGQAEAVLAVPQPERPIEAPGKSESEYVSQIPPYSRWEAAFGTNVQSITLAGNGGAALPAQLRGAVLENNTFSGLSVAVLVLAETEDLTLRENQLQACTGGFWILTPQEAFLMLDEPLQLAVFGLSLAVGYPLPASDSSLPNTVAAAPATTSIYAGAASYSDTTGVSWLPDVQAASVAISASTLAQPLQPPQITDALPAQADQVLYQSERWGSDFTYTFSGLADGFYLVTMKLAEITYTAAGQRVFNVLINGDQVITQLDLVQQYGAATATDQVFIGVPSLNGQITIEFAGIPGLGDGNAKSAAIQLMPQWSSDFISFINQGLVNSQVDDVQNFFLQIMQLAQQGFFVASPVSMQLRVDNNEMQDLGSAGLLIVGEDTVQSQSTSSLIMTGNRIATNSQYYLKTQGTGPAQFTNSGNEVAGFATFQSPFFSPAFIYFVARCIVANNIMTNGSSAIRDLALVLLAGRLNQPTTLTPPPQVTVMSNLFQGRIEVTPSRQDYFPNVPDPMNSWEFLNTVTQ